jgi:hypothetical protein
MTRPEPHHVDQTPAHNSTSRTSKLERDLFSYAIAAAAAGVGILALAHGAEAKVIATKANIVVPINGGLVQFDINGDGIPDFGLSATNFADSFVRNGDSPKGRPPLGGIFGGHLTVVPAQTANGVIDDGGTEIKNYAAALPPGITIGAGRHFGVGSALMAGLVGTGCAGSSFAYGQWKGTHTSHPYLAVKFSDSTGAIHYGWVRILVTETDETRFNATIEGFAYETVPNKTIVSGTVSGPVACLTEPDLFQRPGAPPAASLGMLALGARGLTAWRREEEQLVA